MCCHVGNAAQHCRLDLFLDSDFVGVFEDSKKLRMKSHVFSEVEHVISQFNSSKRQFLTVPQNRKLFRQLLVCEWTGLFALGLWDVVIEVLRSSKSTYKLP